MRRVLICLAGLALAAPALADGPPALLGAVSGDWNRDELPDAAVLVRGPDEGAATLHVYLGDWTEGLRPVVSAPNAVFAGPMAGQMPRLVPRTETSFVIEMEQTGVGRTPWMSQTTVAFRDGGFVVAGYTYDFYDRLDPGHSGTCDVNLLNGRWERRIDPEGDAPERRESGDGGPRAFPLAALTDAFWPEPCQGLWD
jgi:hypothetical protein